LINFRGQGEFRRGNAGREGALGYKGDMRARQSAHMAVLRPSGESDSKTAATSKKLRAAQRRDFFDSLKQKGRD